jgi:transposase
MGRRRGQSYGQDLRDRVLAAVGEPIRVVAARFAVSPSYVSKVWSRLRKTGETTAGAQRNHVPPRLARLYEALRVRVAEQADATIAELRAWVAHEHGVAVSHPVMWKTLGRLGLTLKKTPARRRAGPRQYRGSPRGMGNAGAATRRHQPGVSR